MAGSRGRAVAFHLALGQAHDLPGTPAPLSRLPDAPTWVVADRGCSSDALHARVWNMGAWPTVPAKRNEAAVLLLGASISALWRRNCADDTRAVALVESLPCTNASGC